MVEGAFTDPETPAKPIDAHGIGPVFSNGFKASIEPVRPSRHASDHTIRYGMAVKAVTVIGGGLGGLAAAITAAEAGASVTLHEAHRTLGGRWRSTPVRRKPAANPSEEPRVFRAHEGPHVIYRDGPTWAWLKQRGLLGVTCRVPVRAIARFRFWHGGRLQRVPPKGFLRALRISRRPDVPTDQS